MRPAVREVSKQYAGQVTLIVVDMYTVAGERRAQELKVRSHPVLLVQDRNGQEILRIYGPVDRDRIERTFAMLTAGRAPSQR
jgi:thioredoxin-related protein